MKKFGLLSIALASALYADVYFTGNYEVDDSGNNERGILKTDGTPGGTMHVPQATPDGVNPNILYEFKGKLYYKGQNAENERNLYVYDGESSQQAFDLLDRTFPPQNLNQTHG